MFTDEKVRKQYNETINILPKELKSKTITGSNILVRLFQFETMNTTKNGVIDPNFIDKYSEDGKVSSKLDKIRYRPQAVVVQVGEGAKKYFEGNWTTPLVPGDIIDLDNSALSDRNVVYVDKTRLNAKNNGFMKISPIQVEFIVDGKLELKYEN